MQKPIIESDGGDEPDIHHMLMLVDEAKVAAHALSQMVPDPQAVEGLYQYLRDALDTIEEGLARLMSSL